MVAIAIFLLVFGIDRLVISQRWPAFDPFRNLWRIWVPKVKSFMRSAPGTFTYLFVIVITAWVLQTSSSKIAEELLLERSTNLRQLIRDPMRVLFGSAFWVSSAGELLFSLLAFSVVATAVERWIGTARTAGVFFFGHVGATLLVAFWIWASLNFTVIKSPTTGARDVGSSYGLAAMAALLTYRLPPPRRWFYLSALVLLIGTALILDPSFTNWGHAFAFALGLLSYVFIPGKVRRRRKPKSFFAL